MPIEKIIRHIIKYKAVLISDTDVYKRQGMDNMMNKRTIEEQKKLEELEEEEQRKDERRDVYKRQRLLLTDFIKNETSVRKDESGQMLLFLNMDCRSIIPVILSL